MYRWCRRCTVVTFAVVVFGTVIAAIVLARIYTDSYSVQQLVISLRCPCPRRRLDAGSAQNARGTAGSPFRTRLCQKDAQGVKGTDLSGADVSTPPGTTAASLRTSHQKIRLTRVLRSSSTSTGTGGVRRSAFERLTTKHRSAIQSRSRSRAEPSRRRSSLRRRRRSSSPTSPARSTLSRTRRSASISRLVERMPRHASRRRRHEKQAGESRFASRRRRSAWEAPWLVAPFDEGVVCRRACSRSARRISAERRKLHGGNDQPQIAGRMTAMMIPARAGSS